MNDIKLGKQENGTFNSLKQIENKWYIVTTDNEGNVIAKMEIKKK